MGLWSLLRSVSQGSLMSCRLELEDRPLERASLFPLFDDLGQTRVVMITALENGRIMLADWAPGLFVRDWARRNRLRLRFTDLSDASMWDEERFADLWHFDPVWVLGDERYQGHGAVPALRSTNIPGYDETVSGVGFDRSVGRALYVERGSGESSRFGRFTADTLAAAARRRRDAQRPRGAAVVGWRLRPFWLFTSGRTPKAPARGDDDPASTGSQSTSR
jgi:hypothetical protein